MFSIRVPCTLAYLEVPASSALRRGLAWLGRGGRLEPIAVPPDDFTYARVSPDGASAALVVGNFLDARRNPDLWVLDLRTHGLRQLTFNFVADAPVWSPDGKRICFRARVRGGPADRTAIYSVTRDGGTPELIAAGSEAFIFARPYAVSPDGQTLMVTEASSFTSVGIGALTLGDRRFSEVLRTGSTSCGNAPRSADRTRGISCRARTRCSGRDSRRARCRARSRPCP